MAKLIIDATTDRTNHLLRQSQMTVARHTRSLQRIRREADPTVSPSKLKIFIGLDAGYSVSLAFLNIVRRQVCEILPFLEQKAEFSAKELVGIDYWLALNDGERRILDQCINALIRERLPMQVIKAGRNLPASFRFLGLSSH